jgi:hypothetical protein
MFIIIFIFYDDPARTMVASGSWKIIIVLELLIKLQASCMKIATHFAEGNR